jgi:hypothetical protein
VPRPHCQDIRRARGWLFVTFRRRRAPFPLLLLHLHLQSSFGFTWVSPRLRRLVILPLGSHSTSYSSWRSFSVSVLWWMHRDSTKASLLDLPTTTAKPCPSENPYKRALHAAVDSKISSVVRSPRKAGGKPAATVAHVQQHIITQGRECQVVNFDEPLE